MLCQSGHCCLLLDCNAERESARTQGQSVRLQLSVIPSLDESGRGQPHSTTLRDIWLRIPIPRGRGSAAVLCRFRVFEVPMADSFNRTKALWPFRPGVVKQRFLDEAAPYSLFGFLIHSARSTVLR